MKKKLIVIAAIALFIGAAALYLWAPGSVPPGQKPLLKLMPANISQFSEAFDADGNLPRLVLLLSPT